MTESGQPGANRRARKVTLPLGARYDLMVVSPHYDDAALSCGGYLAKRADEGARVLVVTVFSGEPPAVLNEFARFQHRRWGTGDDTLSVRRREDVCAMETLGVDYLWLDFLDAIYRGDLYRSDDDLFGPVKPEDSPTAESVRAALRSIVDASGASEVLLPLTVGNHVDHAVCFGLGAPTARPARTVWYYEDLPYAVVRGAVEQRLALVPNTLRAKSLDVTGYVGRWIAAVNCYASQVPTIFRHFGPAETVITAYAAERGERTGGAAQTFWRFLSGLGSGSGSGL